MTTGAASTRLRRAIRCCGGGHPRLAVFIDWVCSSTGCWKQSLHAV
jgi:hypothetical protein